MVTLFFNDGHAERHPELIGKPIPLMDRNVTLLSPEEMMLLNFEGIDLEVGYLDPRKEVQ